MVSRDEFRHLAAAACWDKQQALRMCVSTWVWFCFAYVCESETVFVWESGMRNWRGGSCRALWVKPRSLNIIPNTLESIRGF